MTKDMTLGLRIESATMEELAGIAAALHMTTPELVRKVIDEYLVMQNQEPASLIEQLDAERIKLDRLIAEIKSRPAPDLVLVEIESGVSITVERKEAVDKGLKFRERKTR